MFSFLGRESPGLQLYGKLPVAKDYVRLGCGDGAGRALRDWLDRAFGAARDASEQRVLDEPLRFLGQSEDEPLQGLIWPSSDEGGKRLFPFVLFVARKRKALAADLDDSLAATEGVWRDLAGMREECLSATDGQALLARYRGREIELASVDEAGSASADLDAWLEALWPETRLAGLTGILTRVQALARDGHAGPFRLPLVRDLPMRDQVLGWVSALRALGALNDEIPTLFFSNRSVVSIGGLGTLVASAKPLGEADVAWLLGASDDALGRADFLADFDDAEVEVTDPPDGEVPLKDALRDELESFREAGVDG